MWSNKFLTLDFQLASQNSHAFSKFILVVAFFLGFCEVRPPDLVLSIASISSVVEMILLGRAVTTLARLEVKDMWPEEAESESLTKRNRLVLQCNPYEVSVGSNFLLKSLLVLSCLRKHKYYLASFAKSDYVITFPLLALYILLYRHYAYNTNTVNRLQSMSMMPENQLTRSTIQCFHYSYNYEILPQ